MISSPSVSIPDSASRATNAASQGGSKIPDTRARRAPERTMSTLARAPNSNASESTTIDLPLPVSPVSRFSPGWNATRSWSTTA